MKKASYLIVVLMAFVLVACGSCKGTTPQDEPTPQEDTTKVNPEQKPDMSLIKQSVPVTDDWIWSGKPQITLHIENGNPMDVKVGMKTILYTDTRKTLTTLVDSIVVEANGKKDYIITTPDVLAPGFYRALCSVNGKLARNFFFGIDPFDIVSPPDKQPDYDEFWEAAKAQLPAINEQNVRMVEIESKSTSARKVYLVELNSVPDGLEGEPVLVRGYYCEPQDGQPHPVIMHFYGYDTQGSKAKCECPSGGSSQQYAEFYLSHRGQYLNNRPASTKNPGVDVDCTNIYGDWFGYHFGDKNSYYYRGAFMDCVQAVRFMASRPTSDMTKLFAEGSSQGGALTYACAALSDYPFTAIACNVAFLGDFPDYAKVGGLASEAIKNYKGSLTDDEMFAFLSYFDTKNLATRLSCAILASSGLQDNVCPPHTNIAPYNNMLTPASEKEYIFAPLMGHDYPAGWTSKVSALWKSHL